MIRVALRDLAGRKLRSILTALAIVLGVAMISGTYVVTDTISKAFSNIFEGAYEGISAVVTGEQLVDWTVTGGPTAPEELVEEIRALPVVDAAYGVIESESARLIDKDGEPILGQGAPNIAIGLDPDEIDPQDGSAGPLVLVDGLWPRAGDDVVIDAATAEGYGFAVGEQIGVAAGGPVEQLRIVGIARFGTVDSIGGATFAVMTLERAQRLLGREGRVDRIEIYAAPGVSTDDVVGAVEPLVPANMVARSASEQAGIEARQVDEALQFLRYFLLAFAGIALFVGTFVIFNTFSMTVAQRSREFATLRTLGGSRKQVLGTILVETLAIGVLASVVGLFLGLALARGLDAVFMAAGADLPRTAQVLALRTVVASLVIGIGVTVAAGLVPGVRATRVPPILAVREGATLPPSRLGPVAPYIAAVVVVAALAALTYGLFWDGVSTRGRLLALGVGSLALFIGIALVTTRLVSPLAAAIGRGTERLGGSAGRLARGNAARNPARTAATAGALMIGLALVTFVAVLGAGLRGAVVDALDRQIRADYVIGSRDGFSQFPAGAGEAVAQLPEVEVATSVRADSARVGDRTEYVTGIDPATIGRLYRFEWREGSDEALARLARDEALVTVGFAGRHGLAVGDAFRVTSPAGASIEVVVRGIYEPPALGSLLGDAALTTPAWDATFSEAVNLNTFLDVRGEPGAEIAAALERGLSAYPEASLQTKEEFIANQQRGVDLLLNLLYVLLALSVIVSLFGMVNTLALSVLERTRELGLLRAVGMTRRQARRMIRHESVITGLIGAVIGLPLGVFLAALVSAALRDEGAVFTVPWSSLAVFAAIALLAGVLAAVLPARRASRIDVLEALQYE